MSQVIFFDIDRTLFDAVKFKGLVKAQICLACGVEEANYDDATIRYLSQLEETNDFNPEDFITFIAKDFGINKQKVQNIYYGEESYSNALYSDVPMVLQDLAQEYTLGIFSQGFTQYQLKKLEFTGIFKYFSKDQIIISRRKLEDTTLRKLGRDGAVIDDKPEVVSAVKDNTEITPIWLNRLSPYDLPEVHTIHTLYDLEQILK